MSEDKEKKLEDRIDELEKNVKKINILLADMSAELADKEYDSKNYEEAKKYYLKSMDLNPDNDCVYCNLGVLYDELKEYDNAIDNYKKAIELNSNYYVYYYNIMGAYLLNKQYKEALDYLRVIIGEFEDNCIFDDDKKLLLEALAKDPDDIYVIEIKKLIPKLKKKNRY